MQEHTDRSHLHQKLHVDGSNCIENAALLVFNGQAGEGWYLKKRYSTWCRSIEVNMQADLHSLVFSVWSLATHLVKVLFVKSGRVDGKKGGVLGVGWVWYFIKRPMDLHRLYYPRSQDLDVLGYQGPHSTR